MPARLWTSDFRLTGRALTVKTTGAVVQLDAGVAREALAWLAFYLAVRLKGAATRLVRPGPRVWFAPQKPRPWYLVWAAAAWSGARFVARAEDADLAFYFEDATQGRPLGGSLTLAANARCADISKSRVAAVFERAFGYPLAVDPAAWIGPMVEKGEANGVHDGRIVEGPRPPMSGRSYQRLIDNLDGDEAVDLRTPMIGGKPVVVFVKRRPAAHRFANHNSAVALARPEEVYSAQEIAALSAFARAMKLDWGGFDVLRDRASGRLYVVDVNKTDMGPPTSLPLSLKLAALSRIARAFAGLARLPEHWL